MNSERDRLRRDAPDVQIVHISHAGDRLELAVDNLPIDVGGRAFKENREYLAEQGKRRVHRDNGEDHSARGVDDLPVRLEPHDQTCERDACALDEIREDVKVRGFEVDVSSTVMVCVSV